MLNKNRYRLYREHKYLFHVFTQLLQLAATLDWSNHKAVTDFKEQLGKLELLLQAHAEYEESRIHFILKNNNSPLFHEAETQHREQKHFFVKANEKINLINEVEQDEAYFIGYEIYLYLRNFFSENLNHFDYEERVIMPELQRLVSDDEIQEIDRISYRQMSPEQMIHMMEVLFPHMNGDDRYVFLHEIKDCEPEKFEFAWLGISSLMEEKEKLNLMTKIQDNHAEKEAY